MLCIIFSVFSRCSVKSPALVVGLSAANSLLPDGELTTNPAETLGVKESEAGAEAGIDGVTVVNGATFLSLGPGKSWAGEITSIELFKSTKQK